MMYTTAAIEQSNHDVSITIHPKRRFYSRFISGTVTILSLCGLIGYYRYYVDHGKSSKVDDEKYNNAAAASVKMPNTVTKSKIVSLNDLFQEGYHPQIHNITTSTSTTKDQLRKHNHNKSSDQINIIESSYDEMPQNESHVAWMMSLSGSGASYPFVYTELIWNISIEDDTAGSVRSVDDRKHGPSSIRRFDNDLPNSYILTNTHCGDDCIDCSTMPSSSSMYRSLDDFDRSCHTVSKQLSNGNIMTMKIYDADIPRRIIHWIRNPFDNVVHRMHLANQERTSFSAYGGMMPSSHTETASQDNDNENQLPMQKEEEEGFFQEEGDADIELFSDNRDGMERWCRYIDEAHKERNENDNEPLSFQTYFDIHKYHSLPCHTEWYRYIQWHNDAYQVSTTRYNVPIHYMYYENYTSHVQETMQQLYEFLEYPIEMSRSAFMNYSSSSSYPWLATNTSYLDYYDKNHIIQAYEMIRELALPEVWQLLSHYFIHDDSDIKESKNSQSSNSDNPTSKSDGMDGVVKKHDPPSIVAKNFNHSKVVWLISFPNSGTSYTITNTEKVSAATTGSNYAADWDVLEPIVEGSHDGPFFHRPTLPHPEYVLTKTHCSGYCDDCGPAEYVVKNVNEFRNGCATASIPDPKTGEKRKVQYSSKIPVKIVHLLRNPFDNLVSRLHLEIKKRPEFDALTADEQHDVLSSKDGFDSWCKYVDKKFANEERHSHLLSDEIKAIFRELPCHADWYRYIQWHNYAIEMIDEMNLPTHILYYEDYDTQYNETVDDLLDFLQLERMDHPLDFVSGKSYHTYFTKNDSQAAIRLVKTLASKKSWELIKHYFDGLI